MVGVRMRAKGMITRNAIASLKQHAGLMVRIIFRDRGIRRHTMWRKPDSFAQVVFVAGTTTEATVGGQTLFDGPAREIIVSLVAT